MRRRLAPLALAAALFAATPAHAQTPFTFVSGGSTAAFGGYLVGPYTGLQGTGPSAQSVFLYCVDFAHHITAGEAWNANVTSLATGTDLSLTRAGDMTLYREAAWLSTQFALHPDATADIQGTIWNLFQSALAASPSSNYWLLQAQANYATLQYGAFSVVTDVNITAADGAQEFVIINATPEPATLVLLATGLVGVFGAARRRRDGSLQG